MPPKKNSSAPDAEVKEADADAEMKDAEAPKAEETKEEEKPKEPEKPKELEEDAPVDKRKKLGAANKGINSLDTTLDVIPALNGKIIKGLSDGGFQYLLSGARGNVGVKSGRYAFEVTILENVSISDSSARPPTQYLKIGFSTAGSSLFMGDSADSVCFDCEGLFYHNKKKSKVFQAKILRDQAITVLLNLNKGAPNGNTISLFKNGKRITEPQSLPEALVGKTLFPTLTFKNLTLMCNFGPALLKPLPFKVLTFEDIAADDGEESKLTPPKDGKYEVHFPVGLPDEGTFDWLDGFLQKNPSYVELSDRAILEWGAKSGLVRQKGKASNDRPTMSFGLPAIDDLSVRKMLATLTPMLQRNFVVMEVAGNLLASGRQEGLLRFGGPQWKKIAQIAMGAPPEEFKKFVHAQLLGDKQKVLDAEHAKKVAEKEKEKEAARRKKAAEKAAAEAKAKREAAIKKAKKERERKERKAKLEKERKEMGLEGPVPEEELDAGEPEEEEPKPAAEEAPPEEEEDTPLDPPEQATLTEEEQKIVFRTSAVKDLTTSAIATHFRHFSLPEKSEGFDDIKYNWEAQAGATKYLREWVLKNKREQRVEDLTPGEWFKEKWTAWQKDVQDLRKKQSEFKTKGKVSKPKKEGEEEEKKEEEEEKMEIDIEELDVMTVEDIDDCNGKGQPIYSKFEFEDWTLLTIRWELWCLVKAFSKDLDDPDIPGVTETHLAYYYQKYFKKAFNLKSFNAPELKELVSLLKDAISLNATSKVLETSLDESTPMETFVKLSEENRRERERRVDAGDETAKLKFPRGMQGGAPAQRPAPPQGKPPGFAPGTRPGGAPSQAGGASRYSGGARASYYGSAAPAPTAYPSSGGVKRYGAPTPGYGQPASKMPKAGAPPAYGGGYRR